MAGLAMRPRLLCGILSLLSLWATRALPAALSPARASTIHGHNAAFATQGGVVGLHNARLGMRRRAIYLSAGESPSPMSNGADQTPSERRGASGALGRAELLKGVAGTGLGLVLGAGVGLCPRVAHGAGEGGSVVEFPSGKTYREKATPALVEALVYLPQGVFSWRELVGEDAGKGALFLSVSFEGKALMAARVQPMDVLQFPFLAQFLPDNVLGGAEGRKAWARAKNQDLVVRARVCEDGTYPLCKTPLLQANGVSKFLGEVKEGGISASDVRIGASLMLLPPSQAAAQ